MNKYDFDFRRIEEVLYDVLGIVNPTDIMSLKMQIRESLKALSEAIDKKDFVGQEDKVEAQKRALAKELDSIVTETDLDKVLKKCVTIRYLTLLSLEVKIRPDDTYEERSQKQAERNEIFAVSDLVKSAPSISNLMQRRDLLLNYIDSEHRIIPVNTSPDREQDSFMEGNGAYPDSKLDIQFHYRPEAFSGEHGKCLEEAGIYAYDFGDVVYSRFPDEEGNYKQELGRKRLVGVIKKDEFGELRKYSILMEEAFASLPPEFFRDILFSDMLLRNAKNNFGFLGTPEAMPDDPWYKHKVVFDGLLLEDMLRAIALEDNPNMVKVNSNFPRVRNIKEALIVMQEKMEQALKELFDDDRDK